MRRTLATLTAIGMLFAVPAFAQQDQQRQQDQPGAEQAHPGPGSAEAPDRSPEPADGAAATQTQDRQPGQQAQTGRPGQPSAVTPDRLRQVLQDAGFQQIRIIDAAYLIQAQTEDGDTVLMMINPPTTAGAAGRTGTGADTTTGAPGTARPGATGTDGGTQGGTDQNR